MVLEEPLGLVVWGRRWWSEERRGVLCVGVCGREGNSSSGMIQMFAVGDAGVA